MSKLAFTCQSDLKYASSKISPRIPGCVDHRHVVGNSVSAAEICWRNQDFADKPGIVVWLWKLVQCLGVTLHCHSTGGTIDETGLFLVCKISLLVSLSSVFQFIL